MRFMRRMLHNYSGMLGLVVILVYLIVAVFAARLAPYSPLKQHAADRLQAPNPTYLLGTDEFGRDILSRLMHGATNSLRIALISVTISFVIGTLLGTVSGYFGGWADNINMRMADMIFAFPAILLALSISAALGPGARNTILAISIVYLPIFAHVSARLCPDHQEHGLHRSSAQPGSRTPLYYWRPHTAQFHRPLDRTAKPGALLGNPHRGRTEFPWPGYPSAKSVLGQYAQRKPHLDRNRSLDGDLPWHCDYARRAWF